MTGDYAKYCDYIYNLRHYRFRSSQGKRMGCRFTDFCEDWEPIGYQTAYIMRAMGLIMIDYDTLILTAAGHAARTPNEVNGGTEW